MTTTRYPYIPRELYAAVMFAEKIARHRNEHYAAEYAANWYNVPTEDVLQHLKTRIAIRTGEQQ